VRGRADGDILSARVGIPRGGIPGGWSGKPACNASAAANGTTSTSMPTIGVVRSAALTTHFPKHILKIARPR